jgi:hypothetical protein
MITFLQNIRIDDLMTAEEIEDNIKLCEISGSHGGEYEDGCLLSCWAV